MISLLSKYIYTVAGETPASLAIFEIEVP